jgi:hypothetical protein
MVNKITKEIVHVKDNGSARDRDRRREKARSGARSQEKARTSRTRSQAPASGAHAGRSGFRRSSAGLSNYLGSAEGASTQHSIVSSQAMSHQISVSAAAAGMIAQFESPMAHFLGNHSPQTWVGSPTQFNRTLKFPQYSRGDGACTAAGVGLIQFNPMAGAVTGETWVLTSQTTSTGGFTSQNSSWGIATNPVATPSPSPVPSAGSNDIFARLCGAEIQVRFPGMALLDYKGTVEFIQSYLPTQGSDNVTVALINTNRPQNYRSIAAQAHVGEWLSFPWRPEVFTPGVGLVPTVGTGSAVTANYNYYGGAFIPGLFAFDNTTNGKPSMGIRLWGFPPSTPFEWRAVAYYELAGNIIGLNVFMTPTGAVAPDVGEQMESYMGTRLGMSLNHVDQSDPAGASYPPEHEVREGLAAIGNANRPPNATRRINADDITLGGDDEVAGYEQPGVDSGAASPWDAMSNMAGKIFNAIPEETKGDLAKSAKGVIKDMAGDSGESLIDELLPIGEALLAL